MCLHFSNIFVTFAGDNTHDISRLSIVMKRHRSRRQKRLRRDVIGFSAPDISSEDESDDDEIADDAPEPSFSMNASVMSYEGDLADHLDKLASELDGVVRFLRRGSESWAGGTTKTASVFGALAFALEDWDS